LCLAKRVMERKADNLGKRYKLNICERECVPDDERSWADD